jgi:protein-tyrosine phosphatase
MRNRVTANTLRIEDVTHGQASWEPFTDTHCHCLPALDDDTILTIGDSGRYLLLGLPHEVFIDIEPVLAEVSLRGITALIAHPERNVPLMSQPRCTSGWVERGAAVQITAASLVGDSGPWAERAAWHLLTNGLASVVATDAHDAYQARPRMSAAFTLITEDLGRGVASLLCIENPSRVVAGLDIKPVLDDYNAVTNR